MKTRPIAPFLIKISQLGGILLLAACSDIEARIPHVYGPNEVPPEVYAAPRVVQTEPPGATDTLSWPRLGDVPPKPTNFTPQPLINETRNEMINDRSQARETQENYFTDRGLEPPPTTSP